MYHVKENIDVYVKFTPFFIVCVMKSNVVPCFEKIHKREKEIIREVRRTSVSVK